MEIKVQLLINVNSSSTKLPIFFIYFVIYTDSSIWCKKALATFTWNIPIQTVCRSIYSCSLYSQHAGHQLPAQSRDETIVHRLFLDVHQTTLALQCKYSTSQWPTICNVYSVVASVFVPTGTIYGPHQPSWNPTLYFYCNIC